MKIFLISIVSILIILSNSIRIHKKGKISINSSISLQQPIVIYDEPKGEIILGEPVENKEKEKENKEKDKKDKKVDAPKIESE